MEQGRQVWEIYRLQFYASDEAIDRRKDSRSKPTKELIQENRGSKTSDLQRISISIWRRGGVEYLTGR